MIHLILKILSLILPADGPEPLADDLPRGQPAVLTDTGTADRPEHRAEIGPRMGLANVKTERRLWRRLFN